MLAIICLISAFLSLLSIAGLVVGYAGFFLILVFSLVALVTGLISLWRQVTRKHYVIAVTTGFVVFLAFLISGNRFFFASVVSDLPMILPLTMLSLIVLFVLSLTKLNKKVQVYTAAAATIITMFFGYHALKWMSSARLGVTANELSIITLSVLVAAYTVLYFVWFERKRLWLVTTGLTMVLLLVSGILQFLVYAVLR